MRMWVGRLGGGERVVETVGSVVLVCVVAVAMGRSGPRQGQLGPCVLRERRLGLCHDRGRGFFRIVFIYMYIRDICATRRAVILISGSPRTAWVRVPAVPVPPSAASAAAEEAEPQLRVFPQ